MKRKLLVQVVMVAVSLFWISYTAEAGTVRFPIKVSINSSARTLVDTEIFIINLKSTPVNFSFNYFSSEGVAGSCPIPSVITIAGNHTWSLSLNGCFAVALPMPPVNLTGYGQVTTSSPKSLSVYWRIYDTSVTPDLLLDHGKEAP